MKGKGTVEIIRGPFHPHLEGELREFLEGLSTAGQLTATALVVPSGEMRRYMRELITLDWDLSLAGFYLMTTYRLAERLGPEGPDPPHGTEDRPVLEALIRGLIRRGDYPPVYRELARTHGGVRVMAESLRDMEEAGLDPGSEHPGPVMKLYREFHRARRKAGLPTNADPVARAIREAGNSPFARRLGSLAIYGFYDMTGLQVDLVAACAMEVPTTIYLPHPEGHPSGEFSGRFGEELVRRLKRSGLAVEARSAGEKGRPPFDPELLSSLFRGGTAESREGRRIKLISVSGPEGEVEMAAKEILRLHEERGLPYSEIGLVARSLEPYLPYLERVLEENRIPFWSSCRLSPTDHPLHLTVTSLWRILTEDFRMEDVETALTSFYTGFDGETASAFHRFAGRVGGLSGRGRWERILEMEPGQDDGRRDGPAWLSRKAFKLLAGPVRSLLEEEGRFPSGGTWKRMAGSALELLERWIRKDTPEGSGEDLLEDSRICLNRLGALDGVLPSPDRRSFFDLYESMISTGGLPLGHPGSPGVPVLDAAGARGRGFGAVVLLGLNERVWPPAAAEDPFLPDEEREELMRNYGLRMGTAGARPGEERLLFWLILSSAREEAVVIWQRSDAGGRPRVRSWYVHELARAMGYSGGRLPEGVPDELPRLLGDRFGKEIYPDERLTPAEWSHRLIEGEADPAPVAELRNIPGEVLSRVWWNARRLEQAGRALEEWDGVIGAEASSDHYTRLCEKGLSPTALQEYAGCPFRYFAGRLLGLKRYERGEAGHELDGGERGNLFHSLMRRFFEEYVRQAQGGGGDAGEIMKRVSDEVFGEYASGNLLPYPLIWERERETIDSLALEYALGEIGELEARGMTPTEFESSFESRLPVDVPPPASGLRVTGRLDRVDTGPGILRVIDYKMNMSSTFTKTNLEAAAAKGDYLQPPVYLLTARDRAAEGDEVAVEFHYLGPRWEERVARSVLEEGFWEGEKGAATGKLITALVEGIRQGEFFIRPTERFGPCSYCSFEALCRKNHRATRYRLAADERSRALEELRKGPARK